MFAHFWTKKIPPQSVERVEGVGSGYAVGITAALVRLAMRQQEFQAKQYAPKAFGCM